VSGVDLPDYVAFEIGDASLTLNRDGSIEITGAAIEIAGSLAGVGGPTLISRLAADGPDVNDSETFVDSGLTLDVEAGTYLATLTILYTTLAAADIQFRFVGPTGSGGLMGGDPFYEFLPIDGTPFTLTAGDVTDGPGEALGVVVFDDPGTFKLEYAQLVATVGDTRLDENSALTLTPAGAVA
jgi:hypothetical protein